MFTLNLEGVLIEFSTGFNSLVGLYSLNTSRTKSEHDINEPFYILVQGFILVSEIQCIVTWVNVSNNVRDKKLVNLLIERRAKKKGLV